MPPGDLSELFHRAWRSLRQTWSARLAPFELTPHQSRAMRSLTQQGNSADPSSGAGMRLKEIAERLRIAPRSATSRPSSWSSGARTRWIAVPHWCA